MNREHSKYRVDLASEVSKPGFLWALFLGELECAGTFDCPDKALKHCDELNRNNIRN